MANDSERLTKQDTVALWYAVDALAIQVKCMTTMEFTAEQIAGERERVRLAKRALRKVNAIRARSTPATGAKVECGCCPTGQCRHTKENP